MITLGVQLCRQRDMVDWARGSVARFVGVTLRFLGVSRYTFRMVESIGTRVSLTTFAGRQHR